MDKVDMHEVDFKLTKIKDEGNKLYSGKQFKQAIEKFTEGVNLYLKD